MSDFDAVLERLLGDPKFQSDLASNPEAALRGYQLDADERELLGTQLVSGAGAERLVEGRLTKSGVVGLLGPVISSFGLAAGGQSMGSAPGSSSFGGAPQSGGAASFGGAPQSDGASSFDDGTTPTESFGVVEAGQGIGVAANTATVGSAPTEAIDYHTRVDVDGDGSWDAHRAYERADGGVDIHADINSDGLVDFVGHDYDRDGLVDTADFDNDLDGVMDTRMYDDTGDGWMDRGESIPKDNEETQSFGQAPAAG